MEGKRVSPSLLWPGIIASICSQPSPALARAPWSDPAPAVCHETGAQVSNSGCCVGSVQADGVRCPQRLFSCGGPQVRVCFRITGGLFGSPQSLRRTADPVYWPPFMDEETETGEFNALVYQWRYGHLFRGWRGFPSNSLGISGSTCRESPPTSFLCPAAGHPPG